MSSSAPSDNEAIEDLEKRLVDEFELINQRFASTCYSEKIILLKRMSELVVPTTPSLMESEVKIKKHNKRITKNEASTR